jgi:hypothetical protein
MNQTVYWSAATFMAVMLSSYLAALVMALGAYSKGNESAVFLWAGVMVLNLALAWLASVLAAPFIREMDAAKATTPTTPTWEG